MLKKLSQVGIYEDRNFEARKFAACGALGSVFTNVNRLAEDAAILSGAGSPFRCDNGFSIICFAANEQMTKLTTMTPGNSSEVLAAKNEAERLIANFLKSPASGATSIARKIMTRMNQIKFFATTANDSGCVTQTLAYVKHFGPFTSKNVVICPEATS